MTRVAGVPDQLLTAAALLSASGPELERAAQALAGTTMPAMPSSVAAAVSAALSSSTTALRDAANVANAEGVDLKRRGLWLEAADAVVAAYAATSPWRSIAETPLNVLDLVARRRARWMLRMWGHYEKTVLPIDDEYGEGSLQAARVRAFFQLRPGLSESRYHDLLANAGDLDGYEAASRVPLALLRTIAGRTLGPLGVIGGAIQLVAPADHGRTGVGDRVAGAAGAAGSALGTYASIYGFEAAAALVPGADIVVAGLLLGSAAWDVYVHRKAIAHALVAGGSYVLHHPVVLAGPAGVAAQQVWDHRRQVARAAVSTASWGEHRVEDAAAPAVSVAKGAAHEGGKLLGKIGL